MVAHLAAELSVICAAISQMDQDRIGAPGPTSARKVAWNGCGQALSRTRSAQALLESAAFNLTSVSPWLLGACVRIETIRGRLLKAPLGPYLTQQLAIWPKIS
ncbi:hypothetical protein ColKHC_14035 [Colletotrichum higginsianum]|nr:hypothetical protein ColKHC_14035 [Colletotrichum higginsianum]